MLNRLSAIGVFLAGMSVAASVGHAATTNVYATQFETTQGYNGALDLAGQNGWLNDGTGGNGLTTGFISGEMQHAYVGYTAPVSTNEDQLVIWRPINFDGVAQGFPVVKFSALVQIGDSMNGSWDNFRWSIYNSETVRLFSIDFDNYYLDMSYQLDGTNQLVPTALPITNGMTYDLEVTMNFASNRWSATLNDAVVATNQPLTTTGARLDLGDVDAVWLIFNPAMPGDNYMVFDNYQITAESLAVPVPGSRIQLVNRAGGLSSLRVFAPDGTRWAVEGSGDLASWTALKTNTISGGYADHLDNTGLGWRYYRARWVP